MKFRKRQRYWSNKTQHNHWKQSNRYSRIGRIYTISINIPDWRFERRHARGCARAHVSVGCNYSTPLVEASAWIIRRISSRLVNSRNGTETIDNHDVKAGGRCRRCDAHNFRRAARTRAAPRLCTCCTICLTISRAREHRLIITTRSRSPESLRETRAHGPARGILFKNNCITHSLAR